MTTPTNEKSRGQAAFFGTSGNALQAKGYTSRPVKIKSPGIEGLLFRVDTCLAGALVLLAVASALIACGVTA